MPNVYLKKIPKSFQKAPQKTSKAFQNGAQQAAKLIPKRPPIHFGGVLGTRLLSELILAAFFFRKCFQNGLQVDTKLVPEATKLVSGDSQIGFWRL